MKKIITLTLSIVAAVAVMLSFSITSFAASSAVDVKLSRTSITYVGTVQRPSVTVKDKQGKALTYKKDFTVSYSDWNSKNVGSYKVTVKMIGKYSGTKTYTYKIQPQTNVTPKLNKNAFTMNGKAQKPAVTVKDVNGNKLVANKDYTLSYSNAKSKNIGRYTVTVKMKGNYSGSKTYPYYINPKPINFLSSAKGGFEGVENGFRLTWESHGSNPISGYQIQYATKSNFANAATVTINNPNLLSKAILGRAGNTRYYVRIRTYKKIGSGTFYSDWNSGTKSVVTLKKTCNHSIRVGNTGVWVNSKNDAMKYWELYSNSLNDRFKKDQITHLEYNNTSVGRCEMWNCRECKKWTVEFHYEVTNHVCHDSTPTISDGKEHDAVCDVCGKVMYSYISKPND